MKISSYSNEHIIIGFVIILSCFGIVVMYSASSIYAMNKYNNYMFFLTQQTKWLFIGLLLMFIFSQINHQLLKNIALVLIFISWILMIMGFFFKGNNPASRWLVIGGKSWMTTSDLARISLIIFTAFFIEKNNKLLSDWKFVLIHYTPFLAITLTIILFQPDTSTTIMIAAIIVTMLFVANTNLRYIIILISLGLTGLILKILHTPYAINRLINWNDDQKVQALNALGTGGLFGSGLGDSIIKNGYLPQAHTDFILPIIGEELGFIGIFVLFIMFWIIYNRGIAIAKNAPDIFSMFLCYGIIISITAYFLINAAYVIGFAPTTGLPVPFISYGGSHTLFNLLAVGIVLNIAHRGKVGPNIYYRGFSYDL